MCHTLHTVYALRGTQAAIYPLLCSLQACHHASEIAKLMIIIPLPAMPVRIQSNHASILRMSGLTNSKTHTTGEYQLLGLDRKYILYCAMVPLSHTD